MGVCTHLGCVPLGAGEVAMTAHLVREDDRDHDGFIERVGHGLAHRFGIGHPTLQIEHGGTCTGDAHHVPEDSVPEGSARHSH